MSRNKNPETVKTDGTVLFRRVWCFEMDARKVTVTAIVHWQQNGVTGEMYIFIDGERADSRQWTNIRDLAAVRQEMEGIGDRLRKQGDALHG
jgi:hypothetical protein